MLSPNPDGQVRISANQSVVHEKRDMIRAGRGQAAGELATRLLQCKVARIRVCSAAVVVRLLYTARLRSSKSDESAFARRTGNAAFPRDTTVAPAAVWVPFLGE